MRMQSGSSKCSLTIEKWVQYLIFECGIQRRGLVIQNCILGSSSAMENLSAQLQPFKERIPEFILKLRHILTQPEYHDYLSWSGESQIVIKQPKKLEERVLPRFFRHRNLHSFVRQLNMYRFSKVVKVAKERNHMYFQNAHFRRNSLPDMLKITRKTKHTLPHTHPEELSNPEHSHNISIENQLNNPDDLTQYKQYVHQTILQIANTLKNLQNTHPQIQDSLALSLNKCNQLLELQPQQLNQCLLNLSEQQLNVKGQDSQGLLQVHPPALFPSQLNF